MGLTGTPVAGGGPSFGDRARNRNPAQARYTKGSPPRALSMASVRPEDLSFLLVRAVRPAEPVADSHRQSGGSARTPVRLTVFVGLGGVLIGRLTTLRLGRRLPISTSAVAGVALRQANPDSRRRRCHIVWPFA
jgi:hypothetical protein